MRGWFSGDTHLHLMRDPIDDLDVWGQVAAEDVSVGNLLEMGNIVTTHFRQPAWGKAGRFLRDGHMIASGQEDPRTTQRGHTIHHNLQTPFHLPTDEFFAYHKVFEASHEQGGVSGYAHMGQLFNGRRGLALDVPFGLVDFIEVLQGGRLETDSVVSVSEPRIQGQPRGGLRLSVLRPVAARRRALLRQARSRVRRRCVVRVVQGRARVRHQRADARLHRQRRSRWARRCGCARRAPRRRRRGATQPRHRQARPARAHRPRRGRRHPARRRAAIASSCERRSQPIAACGLRCARSATGRWSPPARSDSLGAVAHSAPIYVIVDGQPFWKTAAVASW